MIGIPYDGREIGDGASGTPSHTPPGTVIRHLRRAAGLTQRELARRAHTSQPRVSDVESGAHDPGYDTVERLLEALGHRLVVVATDRPTAADCAARVAALLTAEKNGQGQRQGQGQQQGQAHGQEQEQGQPREPRDGLDAVLSFGRGLTEVDGATRVALCVTEPGPTGEPRLDAFLAATVEHRLTADDLPLPNWVPAHGHHRRPLWDPGAADWWGGDLVTPFLLRGIVVTSAFLDGRGSADAVSARHRS